MRFIDDAEVQAAIDCACSSAIAELREQLPHLVGDVENLFTSALHQALTGLLTGHLGTAPPLLLGVDAFGDPFDLRSLPLARPSSGYAVQYLDTDTLLDRATRRFLPVREPNLQALFASFPEAYQAARSWLGDHSEIAYPPPLAIVPACFDETMQRHVLIYGVLTQSP